MVSMTARAGVATTVFRTGELQQRALSDGGRPVQVDLHAVASIVHAREAEITMTVPMPGGQDLQLTLQRMTVLDQRSRVTFMTEDGPVHEPMLPSIVSYRATLPNNGMAVFTFDATGTVSGMIDRSGERVVVSKRRDQADPSAHIIQRDRTQPFRCGTTTEALTVDLQRIIEQTARAVKEQGERVQALDTIEMKVAVEGDYQLFRAFANRQLAVNYLTELIALVSTIYERDLAVRMTIANLRLWEISNDPYPDNLGIFDGLREVFINEYRTKMTSVDRDIALYVTKRSSAGGIAATIGGICQEDGSYACGDVYGSLEADANGWAWDFNMMAHEVGHVCGGLHTQSCIWPTGPLDSCIASEDGECVTWDMTRPARGTIMSYCHSNSESVMTTEFHPLSRNVISAYIRSAPCMDGQAPARTARLQGIVRDGVTGEPLSGVKLVLGRYIDQIVRQVPPVDGDTITTSGPDGSYSFTGLGYGIYNVSFDDGWVPAVVDNLPFPNSVSVADTLSRLDLRAVRGQRVEFWLTTKVKNQTIRLSLYSDRLPSIMTTVDSPFYILPMDDTTYKYVTFLPDGQYVAVPYAAKTLYTPNKITFVSDHTKPVAKYSIQGASTGLSNKTAIAMGVVEIVPQGDTTVPRLTAGKQYVVRNVDLNSEAGRGTVPEDGVVVLDGVLTPYQYMFTFDIDTNVHVPLTDGGSVYPKYQYHAGVFAYQQRRKPLIARTYRMEVQQRSYEPLVEPTVIASTAMGNGAEPVEVDMPFPVTIIDRQLTRMHVARNGFISFGSTAPEGWMSHPFEYFLESPFSIAALTADMYAADVYPDSNAATPWSMAYDVTGTQPNRTIRVEWKNTSALTFTQNGDPVWVGPFTFQIHLHENGAIDMLFEQPAEVQQPFTTRIGLRGNDMYDNMIVKAGSTLSDAQAAFTLSDANSIQISSREQFTPGLAYHWEIDPVLSVDEDDVQTLSIRPSMSSTSVELYGVRSDVSVRVVDLMGTVVRAVDLTSGERTIDISGFASGRYTAVFTLEGAVHALPFLVTR
jgi:hypothetical protein